MTALGWEQPSEFYTEVFISSMNRAEPIYLAWMVENSLMKSASLA
jgi:hypothetical protein